MLHTHHLHIALTRTNGRNLANLPKKQCSFGNRRALDRKVLSLSSNRYATKDSHTASQTQNEVCYSLVSTLSFGYFWRNACSDLTYNQALRCSWLKHSYTSQTARQCSWNLCVWQDYSCMGTLELVTPRQLFTNSKAEITRPLKKICPCPRHEDIQEWRYSSTHY
jgi:hypothetical protein